MILFPHCKINIGLNITGKRADGFHDIESIFYPLPLKDVIEVIPAPQFSFHVSGLPVEADDNNLCVKAYRLLKKDFPGLPPVSMFLHKHIPFGSGLGGGSADGAFMLRLLNTCFGPGMDEPALIAYASQLGSDCAFFIRGETSLVTGRGECVSPFQLDLSGYSFVLVHPGIHISSAKAFSLMRPKKPVKPISEIVRQPVETWAAELVNDFETVVSEEYPVLKEIKKELYRAGASYAAMTGSGSSFYGIFSKHNIPSFDLDKNFRIDIFKSQWP